MSFPEIEPEYTHLEVADKTEKACWLAQEILYSYCNYSTEPELFEPEEINPEFLDSDDGVNHIRTRAIEVGESTTVVIDCIPIILDDKDKLHQLIEPGFVVARFMENDDISEVLNQRSTVGISIDTTQIIFRMPWHLDGRAIFKGFTLDESARIDQEKDKIKEVIGILKQLRGILREDLMGCTEIDPDAGYFADEDVYSVQSSPIVPVTSMFEEYLDYVNEGDISD